MSQLRLFSRYGAVLIFCFLYYYHIIAQITNSFKTVRVYSIFGSGESEGQYKPYLYIGKAYIRSDIASIEVAQAELKELVLQGSNLYFEELP